MNLVNFRVYERISPDNAEYDDIFLLPCEDSTINACIYEAMDIAKAHNNRIVSFIYGGVVINLHSKTEAYEVLEYYHMMRYAMGV